MKIYLTVCIIGMISVACGSNHRNDRQAIEVPETTEKTETVTEPVADQATKTVTNSNNKAEIIGQTVATCKNPRGKFVLCESGQPILLQSVSMATTYADLAGEEIEVLVSFQGTIKARDVFSVEVDEQTKAAIPDGANPLVSLIFKAPAAFELSVSSLLKNNPQMMDADFSVDLNDPTVIVRPGPVTQAAWAQEMKRLLNLVNGLGADVEKSQALLSKVEHYKVQDSAALKDVYQELKAAITALN